MYSTVVTALRYFSKTLNLVQLASIKSLPVATAAAEKFFVNDLSFEPLPKRATGIELKNKWVFSFFKTDEGENFKCRLWHLHDQSKIVSPGEYFDDGSLLDKRLFHHLVTHHGIQNNYGLTNDSYTDSKINLTISLQSIVSAFWPISTLVLTKVIYFSLLKR